MGMEDKDASEITKHGHYFFYLCLAISLVMVFLIWKPFFNTILMSMICAAVFHPVYTRLLRLFKGHKSLASLLTCLLLILVVIMPLAVLTVYLAQEASNFYLEISGTLQQGLSVIPKTGPLAKAMSVIKQYNIPFMGNSANSMESQMLELVKMFVTFLMEHSNSLISNVTNMITQFVLMIFTLFYFLRDGGDWLQNYSDIIPLPQDQQRQLLATFKDVSMSTVVGILMTAVFQGVAAGIGFWIVGISPVLWGTATAFSSLIPVVGAGIIWLPAGLFWIALGHLHGGIFVLVWGSLVISGLDSFLRPYLMRGSTEVSPVWILFSILGGLDLFGFNGILIGPLMLTMAITLIMIYKESYAR